MMIRILAACLLVSFFASACWAGGSLDLGYGYSKIKLGGRDKNLDDAGGSGGDLTLSLGPAPHVVDPLRLNFGVGFRFYDETGDGLSSAHPSKSQLTLVTGQVGISWKQYIGPVFIEPGIAAVAIAGNYNADSTDPLTALDQTKTGWGVRPSIRAGVTVLILEAGLEAYYMWGDIAFDNGVGGDLKEFYAGAFVGLSW